MVGSEFAKFIPAAGAVAYLGFRISLYRHLYFTDEAFQAWDTLYYNILMQFSIGFRAPPLIHKLIRVDWQMRQNSSHVWRKKYDC
jgi:hypothetical protein